jgi:hypothetical protein
MTITEESLECTECAWVGAESEALRRNSFFAESQEEEEYSCPACREICAHFPLDEIANTVETVIWNGWTMRADPERKAAPQVTS